MEHPRSVSQDGTRWPCCHFSGVGLWHLLAWLLLLCLIPHLAWGHGVIAAHHCFLLSLISLPVVGLGPGELRRKECVALSWLWVSDDWLVCWHCRCCWLMSGRDHGSS